MHAQRPDIVAEILPPSVEEIVAPICVVYCGAAPPTLEWLKQKAKPLAFHADKVRKASKWYQTHNYLYRHIKINLDVLDEIDKTGHLPFHIEHVLPSSHATDALTSSLLPHEVSSIEDVKKTIFRLKVF